MKLSAIKHYFLLMDEFLTHENCWEQMQISIVTLQGRSLKKRFNFSKELITTS